MFKEKHLSNKILVVFFFLFLPSLVSAQPQEYKDYTVEKGDTLWDISNKELKDPFLWPKVWKENPEIKNPDLIYPNQKIRIPLYLLQKEIIPEKKPERKVEREIIRKPEARPDIKIIKPEEKKIEPVRKSFLVDKNLLIVSGYITDSVPSIGSIYESPGEITNLSKGDYAYIRANRPMKKGEIFYIIYPVEEVKHPVTGRGLGTRIAILGTGEVVDEKDPKIFITSSYVEIPIGSLIDNFYEIEPPLAIEKPRMPDIKGYIVTAMRQVEAHGTGDIIFIDKGKNDGVEVGDLLATTLKSNHIIFNGVIQVISTMPSTSAAIIRKSDKEIEKGDPVTGIRQE
jgi:LysM repeat protein